MGIPKQITKSWLTKNTEGVFKFHEDDLENLKWFALQKWRERALERRLDEPDDLSSACKFCSLFVKILYGGKIQGNYDHQYNVIDGKRIDLSADSQDVKQMDNPYRHDPLFFANDDHLDSLESCLPRITDWVSSYQVKMGKDLLLATKYGNIQTIEGLIAKGVGVDFSHDAFIVEGTLWIAPGTTPLELAIKNECDETLNILFNLNADVKRSLLTAINKSPKIVMMLLEHGADVNAEDENYKTALHKIIRFTEFYEEQAAFENIKLLISHDADLTIKDDEGMTFLDHLATTDVPYKKDLMDFIKAHQENRILGKTVFLDSPVVTMVF